KRGTSPRAALDAAEAWLAKAEAANPRDASMFEAKARLALVDGPPAPSAAGPAAPPRAIATAPVRAPARAPSGELPPPAPGGRRASRRAPAPCREWPARGRRAGAGGFRGRVRREPAARAALRGVGGARGGAREMIRSSSRPDRRRRADRRTRRDTACRSCAR